MIDAKDIRPDLLVYVGLGIERAGTVVSAVERRDGRVFARVRLYRSDYINDYPLSVVRAMTEEEAEAFKPKAKKRNAKPWRKRLEEKAQRPPRKSRAVAVSIFDIGREGGYSETEVLNSLRKHGMGGGE